MPKVKRARYVHPLKRKPGEHGILSPFCGESLRAYAELPPEEKKRLDDMVRASAILIGRDTFDFLKPKP